MGLKKVVECPRSVLEKFLNISPRIVATMLAFSIRGVLHFMVVMMVIENAFVNLYS